MSEWILLQKPGNYRQIGEQHHISPFLARILRNRGVQTDEQIETYLHGGPECLHAPERMKDMTKCAGILREAIRDGKRIRVIGDYDVDGVCSAAILLRGLKGLGAEADAMIPHRIRDGYGMNLSMIEQAAEDGIGLILTCDNGIAARAEAKRAAELGITLLITDHHEVPYEENDGERQYLLPEAAAIVDPKQEDCSYPYPSVCGAFIAEKLISCLYGDDMTQEMKEGLLQLAAFATVCDVMPLLDENRVLVREGLRLMKERPTFGIKELLRELELEGAELNVHHLGFMLGPCVNATGRLDTAMRALELFADEDGVKAARIAAELKELNNTRKDMTDRATAEAAAQIDAGEHTGCSVYVIYIPDCHESIAGIVAGRIRESYGHPTLIVTDAEEGLKGSGRSVEAYHMFEGLSRVSELFTRFGGHSQAAGFSLPAENLAELRRRLNEDCKLTEKDLTDKTYVDMELPLRYADAALADQLLLMEPVGNGNEDAVLGRSGLKLRSLRPINESAKLCLLSVEDEGRRYELKLFFRTEELKSYLSREYGENVLMQLLSGRGEGVPFSVLYSVRWNEYRGERNLQLVVEDYQ
ncbi:MAG: single-stranded-DNA-specific exonuclease RecJ [Lachnospiraceae bacterium]|nr:single-stranded-DNA-specific exonuclease RecJ [Lachnospiraceae bacterium]